MSSDVNRLRAAQAKADAIVRAVGDHDGSNTPKLRIAITDLETGQRLATGFAAYEVEPARPALHVVANHTDVLDGTELGDILDDLDEAGEYDPDIAQIATALRRIATRAHTIDQTQVTAATLAGSPDSTDVAGAVGHTVAYITDPATNPALRTLPGDQQKTAQHQGQLTAFALADPDLRTTTSEAIAALD